MAVQLVLDEQRAEGHPDGPVRDTAAARRELAAKEAALLSCISVRLTFSPFDQPEQRFEVTGGQRLPLPGDGRVGYALAGGEKRYEFYVRRYANTLTWSYGANESTPCARRSSMT